MSDQRTLLCNTASGLFAGLADTGFDDGWPTVAAAGFASLLIGEDQDGFGGDWGDFFAVMRLVGYHALALPIGETIIAAYSLSDAGLVVPQDALSIGLSVEGDIACDRFSGTVHFVPWGRHVRHVIARQAGRLLCLDTSAARCEPSANAAGEPRDTLHFQDARVLVAPAPDELLLLLALCRVAQAAGALDHVLEMSIAHANDRVQFGKPLAKLQAVQQNLAILAVEAGAVNSAGQAAAAALDFDLAKDGASFEIAAAKLRTNLAIGPGTSIGHQIHGAIGFTREFGLHPLTRRLIGWRSEAGNDRYWSAWLGKHVAKLGGAGLWEEITRRADRG